jgi:hypothetical protein
MPSSFQLTAASAAAALSFGRLIRWFFIQVKGDYWLDPFSGGTSDVYWNVLATNRILMYVEQRLKAKCELCFSPTRDSRRLLGGR